MFPLFAKMPTIDHTVNCVVAKVGMNTFDRSMKFNRAHGASAKQKYNSVGKYCMGSSSRSPSAQNLLTCFMQPSFELTSDARPHLAFGCKSHIAKFFYYDRKCPQLIFFNGRAKRGVFEYVVSDRINGPKIAKQGTVLEIAEKPSIGHVR
ncbi:MAG: hypothetical protein WD738_23515 [Pirellulales bacterium]